MVYQGRTLGMGGGEEINVNTCNACQSEQSGRYSLIASIYRVHIQTLLMEEKSYSPEYTSVGC